jgi:outer membrane protein TolC
LELAMLNLKRLIDIPLQQPITLTTPLAAPSPAQLTADRLNPDVLTSQRAAVQAAERQVDIRDEQIDVTRGRYRPRVSVNMIYGQQIFPEGVFDLSSGWRTDWNAGVSVQIPIFNGFRRGAEIGQAQIERRQAELQLAQLKKAVQLEYEQALGEKDRARAAIAARQRTSEVAERVYELTVLVYQQGLTTQLQVSDARLQLLQARSNLAQAIADFYIADAGITRAQTSPDLSTLPVPTVPGSGPGTTSQIPLLRTGGGR